MKRWESREARSDSSRPNKRVSEVELKVLFGVPRTIVEGDLNAKKIWLGLSHKQHQRARGLCSGGGYLDPLGCRKRMGGSDSVRPELRPLPGDDKHRAKARAMITVDWIKFKDRTKSRGVGKGIVVRSSQGVH